MKKDLYRILGVQPEADSREIRSAYRTLARKYHPDKGAGSSEERFRDIQDAYSILGDSAKRAAYDRSLQPATAFASTAPARAKSTRQRDPSHLDLRGLGRHVQGEPLTDSFRRGSFVNARWSWDDEFNDLFRLLARMTRI